MAADLKGFFSNCFIAGETGSTERNGRAYRDTIEVSLGGRSVKLVQRPAVLGEKARDYRGGWVETTTVVVADVKEEERKEIKELLVGLSFLLSFATSSDVGFYGWSHAEEPRLSERWATSSRTRCQQQMYSLWGASCTIGTLRKKRCYSLKHTRHSPRVGH